MSGRATFLARETYLRRRLEDCARLLPVMGAILFSLPVLWASDGASLAASGLYLFVVWAAMVVASALVSRALRRSAIDGEGEGP